MFWNASTSLLVRRDIGDASYRYDMYMGIDSSMDKMKVAGCAVKSKSRRVKLTHVDGKWVIAHRDWYREVHEAY
jgi:hypothetical protein